MRHAGRGVKCCAQLTDNSLSPRSYLTGTNFCTRFPESTSPV